VIDDELEIIQMELSHQSSLAVSSKRRHILALWGGKMTELLEYMLPLQVAGKLLLPSGKKMKYADLVKFLESCFGASISGKYDRKTEILSRSKPTVFIEKMLNVMKEIIEKAHQ
jgi:hypothetical protein